MNQPTPCRGPLRISRRELLQVGAIGTLGLSLPGLLRADAVSVGLPGHDRGDATVPIGAGPNDSPAIGSVLGRLRPPATPGPPFVSMPYITAEGRGGPPQPGFFGGWLGRHADPLFVLRDPNAPGFGLPELSLPGDVPPDRLAARRALGARLGGSPGAARERALQEMD